MLDRLTEYYVNLTLWLTPKPVKQEGFRVPGITAAGLVREVGGQGVLDDLVWPLEGVPGVPEELLLGAVVKESVAALRTALGGLKGIDEVITQGLR